MRKDSSKFEAAAARPLPTDEAERLARSIQAWAAPGNRSMQEALNTAIAHSPYPPDDIREQLDALRSSLTHGSLARWVEAASDPAHPSGQAPASGPGRPPVVLGLQAGNLPLAGVQDAVAVLLAGGVYVGKCSRREPWLSGSLLDHLAADGFAVAGHSVDIRTLAPIVRAKTGSAADAVLFSGSAESVPRVRDALFQAGLHAPGVTRELIRTAHLSITWLTAPLAMKQTAGEGASPPGPSAPPPGQPETAAADRLIRSILVHDNRGCRSTAVVVSPESLADAAPALRDAERRFSDAREHRNGLGNGLGDGHADERILVERACDTALGIECLDLGRALITCRADWPEQPGIVHWVQGGAREIADLLSRAGQAVQSVYMDAPPSTFRALLADSAPSPDDALRWSRRVEPLAAAQAPPVDWKPDGVDPLEWLLASFRNPASG